jgi:hypothetical protein
VRDEKWVIPHGEEVRDVEDEEEVEDVEEEASGKRTMEQPHTRVFTELVLFLLHLLICLVQLLSQTL